MNSEYYFCPPNDICRLMITYLDISQIKYLLIVNKQFNQVAKNSNVWKNNVKFKPKCCNSYLDAYNYRQRVKKHLCPLCSNNNLWDNTYSLIICDCGGSYASYHSQCLKTYDIRIPIKSQRGSTSCICPQCGSYRYVMICGLMS